MATTKVSEQEFEGFETPLIRLVDAVLARKSHELHSVPQEKDGKPLLTAEISQSMVSHHQAKSART